MVHAGVDANADASTACGADGGDDVSFEGFPTADDLEDEWLVGVRPVSTSVRTYTGKSVRRYEVKSVRRYTGKYTGEVST